MRFVFDLQACQSGTEASRSTALTLACNLLRQGAGQDIRVVLNSHFRDSIEAIRHALAGLISAERINVFDLPERADSAPPSAQWLHLAGRQIGAGFFASLRPDIVVELDYGVRQDPNVCAPCAALDQFVHIVKIADVAQWRLMPPQRAALGPEHGTANLAGAVFVVASEVEQVLLRAQLAGQDDAIEIIADGNPVQWWDLLRKTAPPTTALPATAAAAAAGGTVRRKQKLAYISPLPPERSGIADYSAQLLPQLARYYEVDVIVDQERVDDAWVLANLPVRKLDYFEQHAGDYDHLLYHFGNSVMHRHMFALLERHPGVVVLHDFYLANLLHYMHHSGYRANALQQALYHSHGFGAVIDGDQSGESATVWKYPCNKLVLDNATGVIVHSNYPKQLAARWYGAAAADEWRILPLLRGLPDGAAITREGARAQLGVGPDEFMVCSFGMLGPTKLNDKLLDAWLRSPLVKDRLCRLVFVGEFVGGNYGTDLQAKMSGGRGRKQISVTGFVSQQLYHTYLAACDIAVQLRSESRGETSASVLDCLLFGVPTIVNAHGSSAELPADVLVMLDDEFTTSALTEALLALRQDEAARARLRVASSQFVRDHHGPDQVGAAYRDALTHFKHDGRRQRYLRLLDGLAAIDVPQAPIEEDLIRCARAIAANQSPRAPRQLLVDVSAMVQSDLKTGIQRVVRSILATLLAEPPAGYRVEPVYSIGSAQPYRYARAHMQHGLVVPVYDLDDAPIELRAGDVFLGLDLMMHGVHQNRAMLQSFRDHGAEVYFVIFDLLPLLHPHFFPFNADAGFADWMDTIATVADGLLCISRSVADEAATWLAAHPPARCRPLELGYFHLGADIGASMPSTGLPDGADAVLERLAARPSLLMVGTVEPRKGHALALAAFEHLWAEGVQINLIILGKHGWMVDDLAERLSGHPEQGQRLFWLQGASDEMLLKLYRGSSALLAASEGEGFGLPLIEAAQHGLPLIARDLPVFREVSGAHAFYFNETRGDALAGRIQEWLKLLEMGTVPSSGAMPWLTWRESTGQLLDNLIGKRWYRKVHAGNDDRPLPT
ncbi:MAG: glycosyltransferase [Massilia sp.]|nr:glycosyltransferase [Massilia sp.]